MTYFSAFSGAGGFELALSNLSCVGYSNVSRPAFLVYRYHFPDDEPSGEIRQLDAKATPPFDLLVAGRPRPNAQNEGRKRRWQMDLRRQFNRHSS